MPPYYCLGALRLVAAWATDSASETTGASGPSSSAIWRVMTSCWTWMPVKRDCSSKSCSSRVGSKVGSGLICSDSDAVFSPPILHTDHHEKHRERARRHDEQRDSSQQELWCHGPDDYSHYCQSGNNLPIQTHEEGAEYRSPL